MAKVLMTVAVLIVVSLLVMGSMAYFVTSFSPTSPIITDGFGRVLSPTPMLMRIFTGTDRLWAGWSWFFLDMVIFWGGLAVSVWLSAAAGKLNKEKTK